MSRVALSVAVIAVALGAPGAVARADVRFAIGNDVFASTPPFDDDGFTNDLDLRFWRPYRGVLIGGEVLERWVTEVPRSGGRRRDLLELVGTGERSWGSAPRELTLTGRAGPTFSGNLGGRWGQNAFHTICQCGNTLDEGLQRRYDSATDAGALVGGSARGSVGVPIAQAYAVIDAQGALGAGVSWLDAAAGGQLVIRGGTTEIGAHLELAVMRYHVADSGLALPGGYRPGWQTAYRAGLYVARGRIRFEYELRANEGGSGEPIGIVAVTIKQAGTAY